MRQGRLSSRWDAAMARSVLAEQEGERVDGGGVRAEAGVGLPATAVVEQTAQRRDLGSPASGSGGGWRCSCFATRGGRGGPAQRVVLRMSGGDTGALRSLVAALEGSC